MAMFEGKSMRENELSLPSKFICVLVVLGAFFPLLTIFTMAS